MKLFHEYTEEEQAAILADFNKKIFSDPLFDTSVGKALRSLRDPSTYASNVEQTKYYHYVFNSVAGMVAVVGAIIFFDDAPGATVAIQGWTSDIYKLFTGKTLLFTDSSWAQTFLTDVLGTFALISNTLLNYSQVKEQFDNVANFGSGEKKVLPIIAGIGVTLIATLSELIFALPSRDPATPIASCKFLLNLMSTVAGIFLMVSGTDYALRSILGVPKETYGYIKELIKQTKKKVYEVEIRQFFEDPIHHPLKNLSKGAMSLFRKEFMQALRDSFKRVISVEQTDATGTHFDTVLARTHLILLDARAKNALEEEGKGHLIDEQDKEEGYTTLLFARLLDQAQNLKAVEGKDSILKKVLAFILSVLSIIGQTGFFWSAGGTLVELLGGVLGGIALLIGITPLIALSFLSGNKASNMLFSMKNGEKSVPQVALGPKVYWGIMGGLVVIAFLSIAGTFKTQGDAIDDARSTPLVSEGDEFAQFGFVAVETLYLAIGWISAILFNGVLSVFQILALAVSIYVYFHPKAQAAMLVELEKKLNKSFESVEKLSDEAFAHLFEGKNGFTLGTIYQEWFEKKHPEAAPYVPVPEEGPRVDTQEVYVQLQPPRNPVLDDRYGGAVSPVLEQSGSDDNIELMFTNVHTKSNEDFLNEGLEELNRSRRNGWASCCPFNLFNGKKGRIDTATIPLVPVAEYTV